MNTTKTNTSSMRLRKLTAISVFCALAYICVFMIRFKVSFLTFDLKDAVMAIGSLYFGPVSAIVMPAVVSILEFLTISDTGVYGLIMNFLSSAVFCLVSSLIYKFRKKLSGAVISLVCGAIAMTVVMMIANLLITPYYMGVSVADVRTMIPTLLFPFNLTKGVLNASVVMLLYKPFSSALKAGGITHSIETNNSPVQTDKKKRKIIVTIVSALVLIAALVFLFLYLDASIA